MDVDADFAAALADWHEFFAAVAGAAATLVGLLFVALALSPAIMADEGPAGVRVWAGQTFHSFLVVLAFALVALIPDDTGRALAITLAILGGQGVVRVVGDVRQARADPDPTWRGRRALSRFAAPAAAYACCLWAAAAAWRGDEDAFGWLVAATFLLVVSASASCWDLLKAIGSRPPPAAGG
jgi:hypothetical protein